ncbi:TPA: DNA polymerase III subunit gamma/tau, partial [Streptococcus pyogenes]|nr:DNA polymerase III subunit gamma/tau [Streptococcus pyogenes]
CDICRDITNGSLEDVIEIDAASNNGVDEIRDIRDKSTYAPSRATYKVYIIDEVHMLSTGAFNALLKTLEEPTENVVFILATTELHKIPATILSRVQRFEFKAIKQKAIREHLAWVLDKEGIAYEVDALNLIARRAEGGMRDALSILDQALSLSPDNQVTIAIAEEITGSISILALGDYVRYVSQEQATQALAALETIYDSGKSMSRFATDLLTYLRDLLVVKAGGDNQRQSAVFDTNLSLSIDRIFQMITVVTSHLPEIKKGTHPRIYAEMMTIQLAQKEQILSQANLSGELISEIETLKNELAQLKQQLSQLQSRPDSLARSDKTKSKTTSYRVDRVTILKIMEETVRNSQQSRQYLDALKNAWNEILDNISAQDRALLMGSEPVLANSENAILAFEAAFNAEQVMSRNNLNDMFGNIMSKAAGFSPNILAVPRTDFQHIRKEFAQQMKSQKDSVQEEQEVALDIPEGFDFLLDKINTIDD